MRGRFELGPVDLLVPSGSATILLGPSGAGKTTFLRSLAGFLPALAGSVRLDDVELGPLPPERRRFGFVPANLGLFPHLTVRANVAYPLRLTGASELDGRLAEWLKQFALERLADRYPAQLSSGERQRVAMARALAAHPGALLWDEPLSALDVEAREDLVGLLRDLIDTERIPLLMVTHDPTAASALGDRFALLEAGLFRFEGPPERMAEGPLDRFSARFLGFANLFTREELADTAEGSEGRRLLRVAGPAGVVVPFSAIEWGSRTLSGGKARVSALRRSPTGWTVTLREESLLFHVRTDSLFPGVRVGETVPFALDPSRSRGLVATYGAVVS